jgi:hypothetical protein
VIDVVAMFVRHLLADPAVSGKTVNQIVGQHLPPDWGPPFILVNGSISVPGSWPAPRWWDCLTQVECYSTNDGEAFDIANEALRAAMELIGTVQPEAVIQEVKPSSFQPLYDPRVDLPRVIVSFMVCGRDP